MKTISTLRLVLLMLVCAVSVSGAIMAFESNRELKASLLFDKVEAEANPIEDFIDGLRKWKKKYYKCKVTEHSGVSFGYMGSSADWTTDVEYEGIYDVCVNVGYGNGDLVFCANRDCHPYGR